MPEKSAYYIGYLIVQSLEREAGLEDMLAWDLDTLNQKMINGLIVLKKEAVAQEFPRKFRMPKIRGRIAPASARDT